MKKILITQRNERIGQFKESRDNLDLRYVNLIQNLNMLPIIMPNMSKNINQFLDTLKPDGILLTSGGNPKENNLRKITENKLIKYSIKNNLPLIGICRGAQVINIFFKGNVVPIKNHVRRNHIIKGDIIKGMKKTSVNSYHDLGITKKTLGKNLKILASTNDLSIECFKHTRKEIMGIMWHPERYKILRKFEKKIIKNFYKCN